VFYMKKTKHETKLTTDHVLTKHLRLLSYRMNKILLAQLLSITSRCFKPMESYVTNDAL